MIRILPSSVHDIFCTFKEIIQFKQINLHPQADMYHPFYSKLSIVNLNERQFLCKSIENRDPLHRNSARRKTIQFRTLKYNNFLLQEKLNSASDKKLKNVLKKAFMGSKTVMLINSVLITTLIPLHVKISMVHLQRAVEMSRFENWKNCNISENHITVVIVPYIANVTISKETKGLCIFFSTSSFVCFR